MSFRYFCRILLCVLAFTLLNVVNAICATEKSKKKHLKETKDIPYGMILPELLPIAYEGGERFTYDISWTGGLKIGEAYVQVNRRDSERELYEIIVRVTSNNGMFSWIYPVDDLHVTVVEGPNRYPVSHESWQEEGYSYESHKLTIFDQDAGLFSYWHNETPARFYQVEGKTYNEFASFLSSRLMPFETGKPFIVPTWADEKRVEVVVEVMERTNVKKTVLGPVDTIEVMPIMTFSGVYDQRGDTVIWYTDDECRIPVKVNSKVAIGSLTAVLVTYENPACTIYPLVSKK